MSPARSKKQAPRPHKRSRDDIIRAVAVAAAIVIVTVILVWLLRPGPAGVPATGGLMNRQPRASWLIGTAIGVAGIATWWVLTRSRRRTRERARVILPIVFGVVLVVSVVGGILWPGGLLRHDVAPPPVKETPVTTTVPSAATTTTPGASGATGASGASGATTVVPTTGAPTTTGASTTTSASP